MLVFKFEKRQSARFISHLDILKAVTRTLRRAQIEVAYSEGFSPHMLINLSNPIPLGIESESEYCCVNCALSAEEFMKRYELHQQDDLRIVHCFDVNKNPNLAGISYAAKYEISICDMHAREVMDYLNGGEVVIEYCDKRGQTIKNVTELIFDVLQKDATTLILTLAFGGSNLRADRLAFNLCNKFDYDASSLKIRKLTSYVLLDGNSIEVDKYLEAL